MLRGKINTVKINIDVMKNFVFSLGDIKSVVDFLREKIELGECRVFAFYGPLGVGKTTLIREILKSLGVQGPITSPTFTYLNCYNGVHELKFYHFDLYRLKNLDEFLSAGFDEYLSEQEGICFIEWPEIIELILPSGSCLVKIDYDIDAKKRLLNVEIID